MGFLFDLIVDLSISKSADRHELLDKLSAATEKDIKQDAGASTDILFNCASYCHNTIGEGQFKQLVPVFKLMHKATSDDDWLLAASTAILPKLYGFYISILEKCDPSIAGGDETRPFLTATVQGNCDVLNALSSIFVLVADFSDVEDPESGTIACMKQFITASAYILFDRRNKDVGLRVDKKRKTCETTYAMVSLLREAAFVLSSVLCSYERLTLSAGKLLTKRLEYIFSLIGSSVELTIQRSLIITLKAFYECKLKRHKQEQQKHTQENDGANKAREEFPKLCEDIIHHMRKSPLWNERAITSFQKIPHDGQTNLPEQLNREFMMELFSVTDMLDNHCFNTSGCKVQIKYQPKTKGKRAPRAQFKDAYVDWNAASIVTHFETEDSLYWPLFPLQHIEWRNRTNDVMLKFDAWDNHEPVDIAIRFHNGLDPHLKLTIENHLGKVVKSSETSGSTQYGLDNKGWAQGSGSDQLKKIHERLVTEKSSFSGSTAEIEVQGNGTFRFEKNIGDGPVVNSMGEAVDKRPIEFFQNPVSNVVNNVNGGVQVERSSMSFELDGDPGQTIDRTDKQNGHESQGLVNAQVERPDDSVAIEVDSVMGFENDQGDGAMGSQMSLGTNMDTDMSMDMNASMDLNMSMDIDNSLDTSNMNTSKDMSLEPNDDDDEKDEDYCPAINNTTQSSANTLNVRTRSTRKSRTKGRGVRKDSAPVENSSIGDEHMDDQHDPHINLEDSEYESEINCDGMDFSNNGGVQSDDDVDLGYNDHMDVQEGATKLPSNQERAGKPFGNSHGLNLGDNEEGQRNRMNHRQKNHEGDDEESNSEDGNESISKSDSEDDGAVQGGDITRDAETDCDLFESADDEQDLPKGNCGAVAGDEDDTPEDNDYEDYVESDDDGDDEDSDNEDETPQRMKESTRRPIVSLVRSQSDPTLSRCNIKAKNGQKAKAKGRKEKHASASGSQVDEVNKVEDLPGEMKQTGRFDLLAEQMATFLSQINEWREHDWKTLQSRCANSIEGVRQEGNEGIGRVAEEGREKVKQVDAMGSRWTQGYVNQINELQALEKKTLQMENELMSSYPKTFDKAKQDIEQLVKRAETVTEEDEQKLCNELDTLVKKCEELQHRENKRCEKLLRQVQTMMALDG